MTFLIEYLSTVVGILAVTAMLGEFSASDAITVPLAALALLAGYRAVRWLVVTPWGKA